MGQEAPVSAGPAEEGGQPARAQALRVALEPLTRPDAFQGPGDSGLRVLAKVSRRVEHQQFQPFIRRLPGVLHAMDRSLWKPEVTAQAPGAR